MPLLRRNHPDHKSLAHLWIEAGWQVVSADQIEAVWISFKYGAIYFVVVVAIGAVIAANLFGDDA